MNNTYSELKTLTLFDPKTADPDRGNWLWQQIANTQSICFDDFAVGRADVMFQRWINPQCLVYEYADSGLVMIEDLVPKLSAQIHFFLWDPDVGEREIVDVGRTVIATVVPLYKLHRMTAMIPSFHQRANRIATWIGFRHEGVVRQTWLHKSKYFDVTLYGLLAHEAEWIPKYRRDVM